jgi:hypothetical protein
LYVVHKARNIVHSFLKGGGDADTTVGMEDSGVLPDG